MVTKVSAMNIGAEFSAINSSEHNIHTLKMISSVPSVFRPIRFT